jgi:ectoine hydroxylase-related dioxygenase (phytanoyl-CoA dioxygenase family)
MTGYGVTESLVGEISSERMTTALQDFDRDGFVVLENVIDADLVEELKEALLKTEHDLNITGRDTDFEGRQTIRIYNLLAHGEAYWKVPVHEAVLPFAEKVLDTELQLSSLSSITLCPGQGAQPLHADDQLIPVAKPHQPFTLNCVWAISDFTEENGATRLIPGSHKAGDMPEYDLEMDSVAGEMPAGSVIFWHGSLWHGGGTNRTSERRYAIANYYCGGFIRQQENQQLGVPSDIASKFPRRLQELCGYSVYKGLYGHVDNQDPITMLGRDSQTKMIWQQSYDDMFETDGEASAKNSI